jgi:hypothetical protein
VHRRHAQAMMAKAILVRLHIAPDGGRLYDACRTPHEKHEKNE